MARKPKIRSITIFGRRWWRGSGRSYCSATVLVNGDVVGRAGPVDGGGSYYEQAAWNLLESNALVDGRERHDNGVHEPPHAFCRRMGIRYHHEVVDVARESDL